jgi:hypothetical protein
MAYTFEACWRKVLLFAPEVPPLLARTFVQDAFARASEIRPWGHLRKTVLLQTLASRTLTIGVTQGSPAITSVGGFVASDVGRQLRIGSLPIYTIDTVTGANAATLVEAVVETTGNHTATIFDGYLVCPADFGRFQTIVDPTNQRQIPFWVSEEQLDRMDPHRTTRGDPARVLCSKGLSPVTSLLGRTLYEWWPQPTAARTYPALYFTRPPTLTDTQVLPGVWAQRGDILVTGALAECARWPGNKDRPNPYFNLALHTSHAKQFQFDVLQLELRDDDQFPMDLPQVAWHDTSAWQLAFDTTLLRSTDATVGAYY